MISDELQNSGEKVNSDILAARLEGLVARMKYEVRNQVLYIHFIYSFITIFYIEKGSRSITK
jgi:hypothetical protein